MYLLCWSTTWFACTLVAVIQAGSANLSPRQLDPISGGDVLRRKSDSSEVQFPASDVIRALLLGRIVDPLGGGNLLRALNDITNGDILRSLDRLNNEEFLDLLDELRNGDALVVLNRLTGGELLRTLDSIEGTEVLLALDKARRKTRDSERQQTLDTLSGMAFGEMKRMDSLSGASFGLSKRNFDEIDNVGFNGWSKKKRYPGRQQSLSLAKKGGRHYSSLAKKNFDEIDRTGFEGFTKRENKASP